jgi:tetratricopeptide (TPR) repeat protein
MRTSRYCFPLLLSAVLVGPSLCIAQTPMFQQRDSRTSAETRALQHESPEWQLVKPHLPDPSTASAAQLEVMADVLRARRFPEDALDYYNYAMLRGGDPAKLMNKIGITELELRRTAAARAYFQQVVRLQRNDAEAWNNLGAVEYLDGRLSRAVSDYSHAIKLNKTSATFHSNLGTAYFDEKRFDRALQEYDTALTLDPELMEHHTATGVSARMLSPADHAHYCFELAILFAHRGDEIQMMHYLTMASEGGYDIGTEMGSDAVLATYRKDPRVVTLERNAKAMREGRASLSAPGGFPALPPDVHN